MMLAFFKKDQDNTLRYYYIHDYQGSLLTPFTFTTIWGKSMRMGRKDEYSFETRNTMDKKLREIVRRRARDGYSLFYSYPLVNSYNTLFQNLQRRMAV
jgi:predicted DNA-binding WGR domain protein